MASEHLEIIKQIDEDVSAWREAHEAHASDVRFAIVGGSEQWDAKEHADRVKLGKPIATYNTCQPIVRSVANGIIGKHFAISLTADGFGAIQEEAEFRAGVIRAIQISGNSRQAVDFALKNAVAGGIGVYRIVVADDSMGRKCLTYRRVRNSQLVVPDPNAQEAGLSDMTRCAVYEDVPKAKYRKQWKTGKALSISAPVGAENWISGDEKDGSIRVAEYWELERDEKTGKNCVYQTIVDAGGILQERTKQPGEWIPIFFVLGDEYYVDGKRIYKGVIRDAKDPQRMLNLFVSQKYEWLDGRRDNSPIMSPAMVADPQISKTWDGDGRSAYKLAEPDPSFNGGVPLYPPSPEVPAGLSEAAQEASQMVKVTSGIYDERLGARTAAASGRAVALRQEQSEVSTAHFEESLRIAREHECRVLNSMIPEVYSDRELIAYATEDGKLEQRELTNIAAAMDWKKKAGFNGGAYGVRVTVSPDFKTKREQFLSFFSEVATKNQLIGTVGAPEMIRAIDLPGGEPLAKMLEDNLVKQGLRTPPEAQQIPPEIKAQMDQMGNMVEQLTQRVEQMTQEREKIIEAAEADKVAIRRELETSATLGKARIDAAVSIEKAKIERETKLQIARIERMTDLEIAEMNTAAKIATETPIAGGIAAPLGGVEPVPQSFQGGISAPLDVVELERTEPGGEYP